MRIPKVGDVLVARPDGEVLAGGDTPLHGKAEEVTVYSVQSTTITTIEDGGRKRLYTIRPDVRGKSFATFFKFKDEDTQMKPLNIGTFTVKIANDQEFVTVRETLRALGYKIFGAIEGRTTLNDNSRSNTYKGLRFDGEDVYRTTYGEGQRGDKLFVNIQGFLNTVFKVKTQKELDIEAQEAKIQALQQQLAEAGIELKTLKGE